LISAEKKRRGGDYILNEADYTTLTRAAEPPIPPRYLPRGGAIGDKMEDLGRLDAPREDSSAFFSHRWKYTYFNIHVLLRFLFSQTDIYIYRLGVADEIRFLTRVFTPR
jgi:hypothetical protein